MNKVTLLNQTAEGFYGIGVVDATGKLKRMRPFLDHNLILNGGMEAIYSNSWANCMEYAVAGEGSTPTNYPSSTQTVTQSGDEVILSSNTPLSLSNFAVGDTIQFYGTQVGKILSFPAGSQGTRAVVDSTAASLAAAPFTIWKTSDTTMTTEKKRAGLGIYNTYYVAGTEWCFTEDSGTFRKLRRTWDFAPETSLTRYWELGVSWSPVAPNLFSRIRLDTPEDIDVGERLRMIYQLNVVLGPQEPQTQVANIDGWYSTFGTECVQRILTDWINNSGTTISGTAALEAHSSGDECRIFVSNNDTVIQPYGYALPRSQTMAYQASSTKSVQVPGQWYVDKMGRFRVDEMVSGNIRSIGIGVNNDLDRASYDGTNQAFAFVFDTAQIKTNTQRLNLSFRFSWNRVLSTENIAL